MRLTRVDALRQEVLATMGTVPVVVGSGPAASARVDGPGVAAIHVRLVGDSVEALAPCLVGGVPLRAGAKRTLVPFVTIRLGEVLLYLDDDAFAVSMPTRQLALAAVAESVSLWPSVLVVEGPASGARLVLSEERAYTIGRRTEADLSIDSASVSRVHLDVRRVGDTVHVSDRGARRGTFLGSDRLAPERAAIWTPHWMIRVGDAVLALSMPRFCEPPSISALTARMAAATTATTSLSNVDDREPAPDSSDPPSPYSALSGPAATIAEVPTGLLSIPPPPPPPPPPRWTVTGILVVVLLVATSLVATGCLVYVLIV